jgi:Ni,Fe-hydrogenase III large subunit
VQGEGVFTLPYGPVRSGVFESVEYLIETPGERIPHLRARVFYKHRGMEARFAGLSLADGTLLAERYEGVASVAHAIAYCSALETAVGAQAPPAAELLRVLHAELERVANHLDSVLRHTEGAGQAVANARIAVHKERLQRLRADLSGSRFGRGVVVPGGVAGPPLQGGDAVLGALGRLEKGIREDLDLLMATPSFVDRLRGAGVVPPELARERAAVGPVGRGSGQGEDLRSARPYAAYARLGRLDVQERGSGDALARQYVRADEIADAFHLSRQALDELEALGPEPPGGWRVDLGPVNGEALGWAEAPQGELLYLVSAEDGRLVRVKPRSASFHNLALFMAAFPADIFTDFVFIEASFGLSIAGVAG